MSVSGLPSVEEVARVLYATDHSFQGMAAAVLALFEAAVPRIRAEALRESFKRCRCGHVFAEHLTPGTECVGFWADEDDTCSCGRFEARADRIESEAGR